MTLQLSGDLSISRAVLRRLNAKQIAAHRYIDTFYVNEPKEKHRRKRPMWEYDRAMSRQRPEEKAG